VVAWGGQREKSPDVYVLGGVLERGRLRSNARAIMVVKGKRARSSRVALDCRLLFCVVFATKKKKKKKKKTGCEVYKYKSPQIPPHNRHGQDPASSSVAP